MQRGPFAESQLGRGMHALLWPRRQVCQQLHCLLMFASAGLDRQQHLDGGWSGGIMRGGSPLPDTYAPLSSTPKLQTWRMCATLPWPVL